MPRKRSKKKNAKREVDEVSSSAVLQEITAETSIKTNDVTASTTVDATTSLIQETATEEEEDSSSSKKNLSSSFLSLETSMIGPDSANARLEAAYLQVQQEKTLLLKKMKELEERALNQKKAQVSSILQISNEPSALKWAQLMKGTPSNENEGGSTTSVEKSPSTTSTASNTSTSWWIRLLLFFISIYLVSLFSHDFKFYLKIQWNNTQQERQELQKEFWSILHTCNHYQEQFQATLTNLIHQVQIKIGVKLDWEGEILPMANEFRKTFEFDKPLYGINVVISKFQHFAELQKTFEQLGAQVMVLQTNKNWMDLTSISKAADHIVSQLDHVDILIVSSPFLSFFEKKGYNFHYHKANYLSQFLLTEKLLQPLEQSIVGGTILHVSSIPPTLAASITSLDSLQSMKEYSNSILATQWYHNHIHQYHPSLSVKSVAPFPSSPATFQVRAILYSLLQKQEYQTLLEEWTERITSKRSLDETNDELYRSSQDAISEYIWLLDETQKVINGKESESTETQQQDSEQSSWMDRFDYFKTSVSAATILSLGSCGFVLKRMQQTNEPPRYQ